MRKLFRGVRFFLDGNTTERNGRQHNKMETLPLQHDPGDATIQDDTPHFSQSAIEALQKHTTC